MADLTIKQGDTFKRTLTVTEDGVAVSIVGAVLTFHLRVKGSDTDIETLVLAHTVPEQGQARLTIPAATTASLDPTARYTYEVEAVDGLNQVNTFAEGEVYVSPDRG